MTGTARTRASAGIALLALVAALGLIGCARGGADDGGSGLGGDAASADLTELSWAAQALESIGFSPQDLASMAAPAPGAVADDPTPRPTASGDRGDGHRPFRYKRLRFAFGKRVLHGEAVVQTEDGTKTVVVQRGSVTAIDANTVTVKSADGFTLTWTFGNPIHVIEHRASIQPNAITVGATVGVAGAKEGDASVARLIVVPGARK